MQKANWLDDQRAGWVLLAVVALLLILGVILVGWEILLIALLISVPMGGLIFFLYSKNPLSKFAGFFVFGISLLILLLVVLSFGRPR